MKIITVSREFGSGGRSWASGCPTAWLALLRPRDHLRRCPEECTGRGLCEDVAGAGDFRGVPLTIGRTFAYLPSMPHDSRQLLQEQRRVLRALAAHGDCIIVGLNAT